MEPNDWTPPPMALPPNTPWTPKRRRGVATGAALIGTGVVAGAIVGATVLSGAATTSPSTAPNSSSSQQEGTFHGDGHGPGRGDLGLTGTVTAVGSSSVTIKTSTATTTYQVDSNSDIDKNGEAKLSDLKVGDAVRFSASSSKVIEVLHAGTEALDRPKGGPGHGGADLGLTGTVTAVGSSSVTIKTSTATTTYQVDSNSDIDKNGEAKLSDLKVGDAVRFNVTGSNVIDRLHAGDEALDRPQGPPAGQGSSGG